MSKHFFKYQILLLMFSVSAIQSYGQKVLDSMLVISVGTYKPTVVDANKISSNPSIVDSTKKLPIKNYTINSYKIATNYEVDPIEAAEMVGEPLTKLYNSLAKIGMGTYTTPYGEVWYNYLRSKEYAYGLRLKHLSSSATLKDYGYAGFSDNEISLYGKKFLKEHTLSGNFDYVRNVVHFYGFDTKQFDITDKDFTTQRFNFFAANAELKSHYTKQESYNHDVKLSFYNVTDLYKSSENNFKVNGFLQTAINKELLRVNADVDYYNYKTITDTVNNTIINVNPNFIAVGDRYRASIGLTATIDVFTESKFYFYPNIDLSYHVVDDIIVPYAGASGGIQKNSFKNLTDNNPFVLSDLTMENTNRRYELFGGIKGALSSTVGYNTRVSYANTNKMVMYVNDTKELLQNRFEVIYDDAEILNVTGEVAYQKNEKLRINLRGDYFNYKMQTELRAWYKPQLAFTISGNYNLKDKIVAKIDFYYIQKQYAKTIEADINSSAGVKVVAKELKGIFDMNIGAEYRYTKRLGFFLNLNNIANIRYFRYSNYPTQRFSLMAGLSYSF